MEEFEFCPYCGKKIMKQMEKEKIKIKVVDLTKTYLMGEQSVEAIRGISLEIKNNEFVSIMGPSGSGKSTLLHLIGGLDRPTTGKIMVDGIDLTRMNEYDLAEYRLKKIGFVFQQFHLMPTLTVKENVELPMVFIGMSKEEREKRIDEILDSIGLKHRKNHLPSELSGGEQQRVSIARAIANDPDIILADEPTGNLDTMMGKQVIEVLQDLHRRGKTIVLVTHDEDIAKHAEHTYHLKDGKILEVEGI